MKNKILFFIFIFTLLSSDVFASGKKDETPVKIQNNEWVLCITKFDTKSLPLEKAVLVPVLARKMVERLNKISYRTRISPEYAYYEEFAWATERATAAKAIAAKIDERSSEIYKGNPKWRYEQNVAVIDKALVKLRETMDEIENNAPVINNTPEFKLTSENNSQNFPEAPVQGGEYAFCMSQNSDAFLTGAVVDFHGRFLLSLKLYISYAQSFVWEDKIVFSQDDFDAALDDILQKLMLVLGGNEPAIVSIKTEPPDALVLINKSFAGRGNTDNLEYPPSTIIVTAAAPDHKSITFEKNLTAAEITEINIKLAPKQYEDVNILGEPGSNVYHGALYVGTAPLTLRLPVYNLEYIEIISPDSLNKGKIVFETPEKSDIPLSFSARMMPSVNRNRVDKSRRIYYWSWGGAWVSLAAFMITNYSYKEAHKGYLSSGHPDLFRERNTWSYVRYGAIGVLSTAGAYTVYRFIRYMITASKDATTITKPAKLYRDNVNTENVINVIEEELEESEAGE